jgi:hypothetical protein
VDRADQGRSTKPLGRTVLVAAAPENRGLVIEVDDGCNLPNRPVPWQAHDFPKLRIEWFP